MLYFLAISLLKQAKAPDIERLKQIRRIRQHIKHNNLIFLAIPLKGNRVVTFMAIKD
jgi:hypothetical protein